MNESVNCRSPERVYRHEWKHEINYMDLLVLRQRLQVVMKPDPHASWINAPGPGNSRPLTLPGSYMIRSLYFDTIRDKALKEKLDGVDRREKFRIRMYNCDTGFIRLEKKVKQNGLGYKEFAPMTAEEVARLLAGDTSWMSNCSVRPLLTELYTKMTCQGLEPKTIVEYTREPFVYEPGNVRVTLDYGLRTGIRCTDFLDPDVALVAPPKAPAILEVKWDQVLPDIIRDIVQLEGRRTSAYSKYAACRVYG